MKYDKQEPELTQRLNASTKLLNWVVIVDGSLSQYVDKAPGV